MDTIKKISIREIAADLGNGFTGGTYNVGHRNALLCKIELESGAEEIIVVGNESEYSEYLKRLIIGPFRELLIGKDPQQNELLWREMLKGDLAYIPREDFIRAVAVVDTCLWVTKARLLNLPLWKLLGGYRDTVPMIGIGGYYETTRDLAGVQHEIDNYKRLGLAGIKFKVGALSIEEDAKRVRAVREAGGDDFVIVIDSNMAWRPAEAVRFGELVREVQPEWLEEPAHPKNVVRGLKEVRFKTGIQIGAGQSEPSVFDAYRLLAEESVDVINMTYNRGGGVSAWQKLAHAASFADLRVAQVGEPHVSMHLMAGVSNGSYVEIYPEPERDPFWHSLYKDRPVPENGWIKVPQTPGLGLALDLDAAEKYAVEDWR